MDLPQPLQDASMLVRDVSADHIVRTATADDKLDAVSSDREYNIRNSLKIPFSFTSKNVIDVLRRPKLALRCAARYVMTTGMPNYGNSMRSKSIARKSIVCSR